MHMQQKQFQLEAQLRALPTASGAQSSELRAQSSNGAASQKAPTELIRLDAVMSPARSALQLLLLLLLLLLLAHAAQLLLR